LQRVHTGHSLTLIRTSSDLVILYCIIPAGVYRASTVGGGGKLSYATVEGTFEANPDHRKEFVKPRARSAQDLHGLTPKPVNLASGAAQVPVLVTNGVALAQT
jgi:hypothetical protein